MTHGNSICIAEIYLSQNITVLYKERFVSMTWADLVMAVGGFMAYARGYSNKKGTVGYS